MTEFRLGQRWVSHSEPHLGLGMIVNIDGRTITIAFPVADEERTYASNNAPLTRVLFKKGDEVTTMEGETITITRVYEEDMMYFYTGFDTSLQEHTFEEIQLTSAIRLNTPQQRLLSGQLDKLNAYELRVRTLVELDRLQQRSVRGLLGCRTELLKHQIYIANEVAQRFAPRVLLADEVGLGKTIEAGMILHQQLLTGLAERALIVVPESLIHQWLVEMLRRFNLRFAIFDEARFNSIKDEGIDNPFETEQLILCSLETLVEQAEMVDSACAAAWDLLIVDEAHHLHWSETEVSQEYQCVEAIAQRTKGLLLLTATPEQVGLESHFARLRLLDPARFHSLDAFREEESGHQQLNALIRPLVNHETTNMDDVRSQLADIVDDPAAFASPDELINYLLDRHGTGRVLFRNTRSAIKGFPERELLSYPLQPSDDWLSTMPTNGEPGLTPEYEQDSSNWLKEDPRVQWCAQKIAELRPAKVLLICHHASTALALEEYFNIRCGIGAGVFHEGMSIIERDRAAAWFADPEEGAQVMVCSEIGSEGRNFQFAHHLVLFDLPLNPDLLEQRIGRLDRIGQQNTIHIHVPYLEQTSQAILFHWYHEGLGLFEKSFPAGFAAYEHFAPELEHALANPTDAGDMDSLVAHTAQWVADTRKALQEGRDALLELNSCREDKAAELIEAIVDAEDSETLQDYMETVFDRYGLDVEDHSSRSLVLRPGDHMLTDHFPGLKAEGMTVTFDRKQALVRDDISFLSWEHPMVQDAMDMIINAEFGNASLATLPTKGLKPGTLLLEAWYTSHCMAPRQLQVDRYLPLDPVRVLVDVSGKNLAHALSHEQLNKLCQPVKKKMAPQVVKQVAEEVEKLPKIGDKHAQEGLSAKVETAKARMQSQLGGEFNRLTALKAINPSIRDEEIDFFAQRIDEVGQLLDTASMTTQAVRLIVTT